MEKGINILTFSVNPIYSFIGGISLIPQLCLTAYLGQPVGSLVGSCQICKHFRSDSPLEAPTMKWRANSQLARIASGESIWGSCSKIGRLLKNQ